MLTVTKDKNANFDRAGKQEIVFTRNRISGFIIKKHPGVIQFWVFG